MLLFRLYGQAHISTPLFDSVTRQLSSHCSPPILRATFCVAYLPLPPALILHCCSRLEAKSAHADQYVIHFRPCAICLIGFLHSASSSLTSIAGRSLPVQAVQQAPERESFSVTALPAAHQKALLLPQCGFCFIPAAADDLNLPAVFDCLAYQPLKSWPAGTCPFLWTVQVCWQASTPNAPVGVVAGRHGLLLWPQRFISPMHRHWPPSACRVACSSSSTQGCPGP